MQPVLAVWILLDKNEAERRFRESLPQNYAVEGNLMPDELKINLYIG